MISYIIPAKDEEKFISDCIKSLYKQNIQEEREIIVVDNNCLDQTSAVVRRNFPQVKIVNEPVLGISRARQAGLRAARGDVLVFVDADMRLPVDWTKRVVGELRRSSQTVAISGPYKYYQPKSWYLSPFTDFFQYFIYLWSVFINATLGRNTILLAGDMAIKRASLEAIGGFDTRHIFYREDVDTARRLHKFGKVIFNYEYWAYSSARRFNRAGLFRMAVIYFYQHILGMLSSRPAKHGYKVYR